MNTNDDPKPSNPFAFTDPSGPRSQTGMTLRDYFAAKSLGHIPALIDAMDENPSYYNIARHAYGVADAMLREREKP